MSTKASAAPSRMAKAMTPAIALAAIQRQTAYAQSGHKPPKPMIKTLAKANRPMLWRNVR